jgi:hypothetical protein
MQVNTDINCPNPVCGQPLTPTELILRPEGIQINCDECKAAIFVSFKDLLQRSGGFAKQMSNLIQNHLDFFPDEEINAALEGKLDQNATKEEKLNYLKDQIS